MTNGGCRFASAILILDRQNSFNIHYSLVINQLVIISTIDQSGNKDIMKI